MVIQLKPNINSISGLLLLSIIIILSCQSATTTLPNLIPVQNDNKNSNSTIKLSPIKIIDKTPWSSSGSNTQRSLSIAYTVAPNPAAGPEHMLQLKGHCFRHKDIDYKYEFCPFYNTSQREISSKWNPYHGLMGVWQEWIIENNFIIGMLFSHGDNCGDEFRQTKVYFLCSLTNNSLSSAKEVKKCHYRMDFFTQLVCQPEWSAVFYNLPESEKNEWLEIQADYQLEFITEKGLEVAKYKLLNKLGWLGGLNVSSVVDTTINEKEAESFDTRNIYNSFNSNTQSIEECQNEIVQLRERIKLLEGICNSSNISTTTNSSIENTSLANDYTDTTTDLIPTTIINLDRFVVQTSTLKPLDTFKNKSDTSISTDSYNATLDSMSEKKPSSIQNIAFED